MFDPIEDSMAALKKGGMVILVDDHTPGHPLGYLYTLSEHIQPEIINYMITQAKGLVCIALTKERAKFLNIPLMVNPYGEPGEKAFTVSVDYTKTSTGISAYERAETIQALLREESSPEDFKRPGHMFPLVAESRGLLDKKGIAEAAVDLAQFCDSSSLSGTFCEVLGKDGSIANMAELKKRAKEEGLKTVSMTQLYNYRKKTESLIERIGQFSFPTRYGMLHAIIYINQLDDSEYLVVVEGSVKGLSPIPLYMYAGNILGDLFVKSEKKGMSNLCRSLEELKKSGHGVLIYRNIRYPGNDSLQIKQTGTTGEIWDEVIIQKILKDIHVADVVVKDSVS